VPLRFLTKKTNSAPETLLRKPLRRYVPKAVIPSPSPINYSPALGPLLALLLPLPLPLPLLLLPLPLLLVLALLAPLVVLLGRVRLGNEHALLV